MHPIRFEKLTAREHLALYDAYVALCSVDDDYNDEPSLCLFDGQGSGGSVWEREFER
jgi:hypothetical protein